jgi:hypothetical protein
MKDLLGIPASCQGHAALRAGETPGALTNVQRIDHAEA